MSSKLYEEISVKTFNRYWDNELAIAYVREHPLEEFHYCDHVDTIVHNTRSGKAVTFHIFNDRHGIDRFQKTSLTTIWKYVMSEGLWRELNNAYSLKKMNESQVKKEPVKEEKKRKPSVKIQGKIVGKKKLAKMFGGKDA